MNENTQSSEIFNNIYATFKTPEDFYKGIKCLSKEQQLLVARHHTPLVEFIEDRDVLLELVKEEPFLYTNYIKDFPEEVQEVLVTRNYPAIKLIDAPSEKVQLALVKVFPRGISYINKPTEAVQMAAVRADSSALWHIINPTPRPVKVSEAVQLASVKQDGEVIEYIENPSEEVKRAAVRQNVFAVDYIDSITEEEIVELLDIAVDPKEKGRYMKAKKEEKERALATEARDSVGQHSFSLII